MRLTLRKTVSLTALAIAAMGALTLPANAQSTFATFSNASTLNFHYDNPLNTFTSVTSAIPVFFTFDINTAYAPAFTPIAATLNFTSTGAAAVDGVNHLPLTNVTMTITANTPGLFGSNLLTLTSSTGSMNGTVNGNAVPVSGDTAIGNTVIYSSAYLNFASTTQRVFALTNSDATPNYAIAGNSRPGSFSGTYVGTFSSNPLPVSVVPEAGTVALVGMVLPLVGGILIRRRRTQQ